MQVAKANKKEKYVKLILLIIFLYNIISKNIFDIPAKYMVIIDVTCILLFFSIHLKKNSRLTKLPYRIMGVMIASFVVGKVVNGSSITNFMWGYKTMFLPMLFFFICSETLSLLTFHRIFKYLILWQVVNLACAVYQYVALDLSQDFNNGAFISGRGQDFFCGSLVAYYFYMFQKNKKYLTHFLFCIVSSMAIAILEEEKFIFLEIGGILAYYFLHEKISFQKIFVIGIFVLTFFYGARYMIAVYGDTAMNTLTTFEGFSDYATMQGSGYNLPRIGSSFIISETFFHDISQQLLGLGLGMCEDSSFSFIDTSFFNQYGDLNYLYFPFQTIYLQCGLTGITLFLSFFLSILCVICKERNKCSEDTKYIYEISFIMTFICIVTIWYNGTLRLYDAFFPYFMLSFCFVAKRQLNEREFIKC